MISEIPKYYRNQVVSIKENLSGGDRFIVLWLLIKCTVEYILSVSWILWNLHIYLGREYHPDFIIEKGDDCIIIEHFGNKSPEYITKQKIIEYDKLCKENKNFYFEYTTEEDICNLGDKLGKKLNKTPLKKPMWS